MNRSATRLLFHLALLVVAAGTLPAQTLPGDRAHDGHGCGTSTMMERDHDARVEKFRRENPEAYNRLVASEKTPRRARITAEDYIEIPFYVDAGDNAPQPYKQINAVLIYNGRFTRLWVDVADTGRLKISDPKSQVHRVARGLDTATAAGSRDPNKGIVQNNVELFGTEPKDVAQDNGTDFLLTDIINPGVLGYFHPQDQRPKTQNPFSNEMNVLYVDDRQGFQNMEVLLSTLAHEHQHLIHYGRNQTSRNASRGDLTIFNEGLAELASILNGYYDRAITLYMANTNVDMFRYTRDNLTLQNADYERATNFLTYLHEQFGEKFIYDIVGLGDVGMLRINSALELSGYNLSQFDWRTVMRNYTVANYVKVPPQWEGAFGIRNKKFQGSKVNPVGRYNGTDYPRSASLTLERNGSAYYEFNDSSVINYSYTHPAGRPVAVMAMYYKGSVLARVDALEPNVTYQLGRFGGPYTRTVLGVVNMALDAGTTQYSYTAEPLVLGVDGSDAAAAGLAIGSLSPNPVREQAIVSFSARSGGRNVRLDLYDAQGRHMNTLFDGAGTSGGMSVGLDASALPSGVYMLRLRQGDHVVTRQVVVTK